MNPEIPVARPPMSRGQRAWMVFFCFVIFCAGVAFTVKLYEFFHDLTNEDGLHFAGAHLLTYCLVAGGFFLLLGFAFVKGHFSDIEKPKFDLLDTEAVYDRQEFGPQR